jgi:hypothetical protein
VSPRVALIVLLAFQLVIGSLLQATQASAQGSGAAHAAAQVAMHLDGHANAKVVAGTGADCPMHNATRDTTHPAGSSKQDPNNHGPAGSHDCCHANACQCHCVQTPAAVDLQGLNVPSSAVALPSLANAQFVAPRIDEFLRPPIA